MFNSGDTEKTFTFGATADSADDDDESVKVTFGTLPDGVTEGSTKETVVSITDDDVPQVAVNFGAAAYSVEESDDTSTTETKENEAVVTVTLSVDPERTVTIPLTKAEQGGATSSDYSGVPASCDLQQLGTRRRPSPSRPPPTPWTTMGSPSSSPSGPCQQAFGKGPPPRRSSR